MGFYLTEEEDENASDSGFADFDDLLEQWKEFVQNELQGFKVINSKYVWQGMHV